jgi:archaellum component FlaC
MTSSTVGASTAATTQLRQLHQVEVQRLQSEIEVQRSKVSHMATDAAAVKQNYEHQISKLQVELDRLAQAEAAARLALSHDR